MKRMCKVIHVIIMMILTFGAQAQKKDANLVLSKIQGQKPRNIIFILTDDHRYDFMGFTGRISWLPTTYGVRTDKFKYIHYMGIWDTNELYDLEKDPNETTNLIAGPEYADTVKKLTGYLFDWLQQTDGMQIPLKRTIKHPSGDYRHPDNY